MFYFVVKYFRWLSKVPLMTYYFDALLLCVYGILNPGLITILDELESQVLKAFPEVGIRIHRFGGLEFFDSHGRELGHVHGNGLMDVHLSKADAASMKKGGRVLAHHVIPQSGYISFQLKRIEDIAFAIELMALAGKRFKHLEWEPGLSSL